MKVITTQAIDNQDLSPFTAAGALYPFTNIVDTDPFEVFRTENDPEVVIYAGMDSGDVFSVIGSNATSGTITVEDGTNVEWGTNLEDGTDIEDNTGYTSETTTITGASRVHSIDVSGFSGWRGIRIELETTASYLEVALLFGGSATTYRGPLYGFSWEYLNLDIIQHYYYGGTPYIESRPKPRIVNVTSTLSDASLSTFLNQLVDDIGSDPALWVLDDGSNGLFSIYAMIEQFPRVGFDYFQYSNTEHILREII
jgi:hypothetical protein